MKPIGILIICLLFGCTSAPIRLGGVVAKSTPPRETHVSYRSNGFYENDTITLIVNLKDSCNSMPVLIKDAKTVYPEIARRAGVEGSVAITMFVDIDGKVIKVNIINSDSELFNMPVLDSAVKYEFQPYKVKCVSRPFTAKMIFTFTLIGP